MAHVTSSVLSLTDYLDEAEALYRTTLEARKRVLGIEHDDTLCTMNSLGTCLQMHGKLDDAEAVYHITVDARKNKLGDHHPDTLGSANNQAVLLSEQGEAPGG